MQTISKFVLGSFNSESSWRPNNIADLPNINGFGNHDIIEYMDELLVWFCQKDDFILTKHKFNIELKQYLGNIGISFNTACYTLESPICSKISSTDHAKKVLVYSVQESLKEFTQINNIPYEFPALQTVIKVNSKCFCTDLLNNNNIPCHGVTVNNICEMKKICNELLEKSPIIVKDPYGVSGKGNYVVRSPKVLETLVQFVDKQIQNGKRLELVIEPFLDCKLDFSSQIYISKSGGIKIISIQKMINKNNCYFGSELLNKNDIEEIDLDLYFNYVYKVCTLLFKEGYFGPVCIDSMLLRDKSLVPVVEINARYSMGFIFNQLYQTFNTSKNEVSKLVLLNIRRNSTSTITRLIDILNKKNICFNQKSGTGVVLLSGNTLINNYNTNYNQNLSGRLYTYIIASNVSDYQKILEGLKIALHETDIYFHDSQIYMN